MSIFDRQPSDGVRIYSFAINDEGLCQITYILEDETANAVAETRTVTGPTEAIRNLEEVMDDIREALDDILRYRRNPNPTPNE